MLDHILIPLDGHPTLAAALPAIRPFLSGTGAHVHLLLVQPPPTAPEQRGERLVYLDELQREAHRAGHDYLARQGSVLAYDGIVVQREVCCGELVAETLTAARRHSAQVIALATVPSTPGLLPRRPSLAQRLMAQLPVPVLTLPVPEPPSPGLALQYRHVPV
jgi:nucleotide-binding universal stress UspA family protein